ncbi:MAG: S9 family peptidase [Gemmatimonadota bacterium]
MSKVLYRSVLAALYLAVTLPALAQERYKLPPKVVVDIVDAAPAPTIGISPQRDRVLIVERMGMPTIADLAQPMHGLAGIRINPRTFAPHAATVAKSVIIKDIGTGREVPVQVPADATLSAVWSPDGKLINVVSQAENGAELWIADAVTGQARKITDRRLNATYFGSVCTWLADATRLLCRLIPQNLGAPPTAPLAPTGPIVQETSGKSSPARTYQDLLSGPHDEALFRHYFTAQLALIDAHTGSVTEIGKPAIFTSVLPSPDNNYLLVTRVPGPYPYTVPIFNFPHVTEVWNAKGEVVNVVANYPVEDDRPSGFVTTLPRAANWRPTEPATLLYVEALDEGNPRKPAEKRDRVMMMRAPFTQPTEVAKTPNRFAGITWLEKGGAFISDIDYPKRWRRTWSFNPDRPAEPWRSVWDLSMQDAYRNPGTPVNRPGPINIVLQQGDYIYLEGQGASPEGNRPFLDRLNVRTLKTERLWRSGPNELESFVALVDDDATRIITRRESVTEPPNYVLRNRKSGRVTALTNFANPHPQLAGVTKQLVKYTRNDGVPLSATLYLPTDYKQGSRLPVVMWAYPTEFQSADVAGQVRRSPNVFTRVGGISHLFLLTQGYAVFDNPTMPIVGGDTANNHYVEQLVASAEAAVDKVVELGVGDRERIGVGGHSYGAFMTANLLAHTDLFRAGIARSGAYNRTLTPFGFQNEERTYWEAPDVYNWMSPFNYADKIKEPILLTHGAADNNSGTFPMQSERLYAALKGHGGTVRYVVLPHEAHGYAARESVLHTLAEMIEWFDKHVKNAKPRTVSRPGVGQPTVQSR